jgi:hypothetical protein
VGAKTPIEEISIEQRGITKRVSVGGKFPDREIEELQSFSSQKKEKDPVSGRALVGAPASSGIRA